ncbi:MAG: 30S ribosome-binding factor RbfA [Brevinemataceae bacterium]
MMIKKNFGNNELASRRVIRFEKNLQREIAQIIMTEIKDPGINALISVLDVHMSKDYEIAYVKVRVFGSEKKDIFKTLDALKRSAGYISSIAGSNLGLRRSPEIRFEPVNDDEFNKKWLTNTEIDN